METLVWSGLARGFGKGAGCHDRLCHRSPSSSEARSPARAAVAKNAQLLGLPSAAIIPTEFMHQMELPKQAIGMPGAASCGDRPSRELDHASRDRSPRSAHREASAADLAGSLRQFVTTLRQANLRTDPSVSKTAPEFDPRSHRMVAEQRW